MDAVDAAAEPVDATVMDTISVPDVRSVDVSVCPNCTGWRVRTDRSLTAYVTEPAGLGRALALSDDATVLVVGDDNYGGALVYQRANTTDAFDTPPMQTLSHTPSNGFGISVALSGDGLLLAVGSPNDGSGRVTIYHRSSVRLSFDAVQTLDGPAGTHQFATALAFTPNGLILAVGDWQYGDDTSGAVHVYARNSTAAPFGAPQQTLVGPIGSADFGCSVALGRDGTLLAVGDFHNNRDGASGLVHLFRRAAIASNFSMTPVQSVAGPVGSRYFGIAVALGANQLDLAVGDYHYGLDNNRGAVHVYARNNAAASFSTQPEQSIAGPGGSVAFGVSVALAAEGNEMYVGDNEYGGMATQHGATWGVTR